MGQRGPQPTPTPILEARGSWRAKTRDGEPEVTGIPLCPDWLSDDAKQAWNRLIPMLTSAGIIGEVDENALTRYCQTFALWQICAKFTAEHGMTYPVRNVAGKVTDFKEFAQVGRASRLSDQLLRIEQNFGMTPSARASLSVGTTKAKPPSDDELFFGPKIAG